MEKITTILPSSFIKTNYGLFLSSLTSLIRQNYDKNPALCPIEYTEEVHSDCEINYRIRYLKIPNKKPKADAAHFSKDKPKM
jgi:hypothetical protein